MPFSLDKWYRMFIINSRKIFGVILEFLIADHTVKLQVRDKATVLHDMNQRKRGNRYEYAGIINICRRTDL